MSDQARSIEEVITRLNALDKGDNEREHAEADQLLLDALMLSDEGYKVVEAYQHARDRVGFWYA